MDNHRLVRRWQKKIKAKCRAVLGRPLFPPESDFIDRRGGFMALEEIENTVEAFAGSPNELQHYLNSEISDPFNYFRGIWNTVGGKRLLITKLPAIGMVAVYFQSRSMRPHILHPCTMNGFILGLYLHWLGPLEAMLFLAPGTKIDGRVPILIPELECGPESLWERDAFGFPWLAPLEAFRRVA